MNKLQIPIDYEKTKYITYPGHCVAKINGIRMAIKLDNTRKKLILFNGDKIYNFPYLEIQLFNFLKLYPNVIFDVIIGKNDKDIDLIKELIKRKSVLLDCYIIDTLLINNENKSNIRALLFEEMRRFLESYKESRKLINLYMPKLYYVSTLKHFKSTVNGILKKGYQGVFYRYAKQVSPFNIVSKYDFIKLNNTI